MTAEALDQTGADVEAEAGPAHFLALAPLELREALEDAQVIVRLDAGPVVFDHEAHAVAHATHAHADGGAAAVLERVVGQVQQHAVEVVAVGGHQRWLGSFERQRELALGPGGLQLRGDVGGHAQRVDILETNGHLPLTQPAGGEQVLDQRVETAGVAGGGRHQLVGHLRAHAHAALQGREAADDGGEWRLQLVGDGADELTLKIAEVPRLLGQRQPRLGQRLRLTGCHQRALGVLARLPGEERDARAGQDEQRETGEEHTA